MRGIFVTGTDTDVGKTVASAWLARKLDADYWKPIQCGTDGGTDSDEIAKLTGFSAKRIHPSRHVFAAPKSPHEAAALEGMGIFIEDFELPLSNRPIIVEGAGGILVPLNGRERMVDLAVALDLPVIIAARSTLGTINHTLLTIECLRNRGIEPDGVIMIGPSMPENRNAVEQYGKTLILADIPMLSPLNAETLAAVPGASSEFLI